MYPIVRACDIDPNPLRLEVRVHHRGRVARGLCVRQSASPLLLVFRLFRHTLPVSLQHRLFLPTLLLSVRNRVPSLICE